MDFKIKQRQGVVVYLFHLKNSRQLKRFGTIHYVSRRMKYVVLYMDQEAVSESLVKLKEMRFVKKVMPSPLPELKIDFSDSLGDYKLTDEDREKFKDNKE
ncbi:YlbG family protein [Liquorilactobacillus satsumensis]|uniref:UPF0298 protein FD50_GL002487 n=1 Tax=Liquorilactobacillus satsumensis DSM 16230 = JCM 12392 TaxID=1423801 RepID=A0A0R1V2M3_9LACO|nr:YlbG family protein [Liquorilactobacillus satsumensis]KRL99949.1 hypothetical protein FD50_GL002487 [Liquorilactobacillus satsumensis DSM 16230 = JCM 12392]MCC7665557.1 DUF2129 domain-containing protein [Liquorilactobacillus satsumensis]MCP9311771.1 YlbG family protein [Liquorilactobacillus satsumensis]MCP9328429.1 YlbG family protein [Liquorilactobacillus satsumensis]MCP9357315.1 YlbG family protein [Liquorilactobacillus satsumensis]